MHEPCVISTGAAFKGTGVTAIGFKLVQGKVMIHRSMHRLVAWPAVYRVGTEKLNFLR